MESGFFQREIAEAAYWHQLEEDRKERITVGVNEYATEESLDLPLLKVDRAGEQLQIDRLGDLRRRRDGQEVARKLSRLEQAARGSENLMPHILEAVNSYATLGEMMDVLRGVFGEYEPTWEF